MAHRQEVLFASTIWALLACSSLHLCCAKKAGGSVLLTANSTVFLTKFCFTYNHIIGSYTGHINVTLRAPDAKRPVVARALLLDDEPHSYTGPSRQWSSLSCDDKGEHAKASEYLDWQDLSAPQGQFLRFQIGQHLQPRFWYLALADCSGDDLHFTWEAHFSNLDFGWAHEFSHERVYSLHLFLLLTVVYSCLAMAQRHVNVSLTDTDADNASNKAVHPFARTLHAGLLLALGEALLLMVHSLCYAYNGYGAPFADKVAQLLAVSSSFVLVSLLLLVSEGKCVSYVMVAGDVRSKFRLLGPFLLSCFMLEHWGEYSVSQNYTTDYVYTTPCGVALILVDLLFLGAYLRNLCKTYAAEKEQREGAFYRTWGLVYSLWFLVLPVTALLAQVVLEPYMWYMVCIIVKKGVTALVYASLVKGLWPGNVRSFFKLRTIRASLPALLGHGATRFVDLDLNEYLHKGELSP